MPPVIKSKQNRKIRYAVIAAGHISQAAFMPGVEHTGNSELVAVVTGDAAKAKFLQKKYNLKIACDYDSYATLLASGDIDAVYIASPNEQHLDQTLQALKAGIHVLLEKPMAVSVDECRKMRAAQAKSSAKLMIAYRLHFEPVTLEVVKLIRQGKIGAARLFTCTFCQKVPADNHRAHKGFWSGPVTDMGAYPINAARMMFGAEPVGVYAVASRSGRMKLDDTVSVMLKFPGERLAQFTVSYDLPANNSYVVTGDKGSVTVDPGFTYGEPLAYSVKVKGKVVKQGSAETDQFGAETRYFSECILQGRDPEPDGLEGQNDVAIMAAIEKSLATGRMVTLALDLRGPIDPAQAVRLPPVPALPPSQLKNVRPPAE